MARYILILLFLFSIACKEAPMDNANIEIRQLTKSESKLVNASERFGYNIFQKINESKKNENIFISPISISFALGMTLNGAASSTSDSIRNTLFISDLSKEEINSSYRSLIDYLYSVDTDVKFKIANAIFYRNIITFKKEFIDINKKYFNASVDGLDFSNPRSVDIINNWAKEETEGKIPVIVERIPNDIIMYILNAIYFKGDWKYAFDKNMTKEDWFKKTKNDSVKCDMMNKYISVKYFENEYLQLIELPYANDAFCMNIILPKEDINELIKKIDSEKIKLWYENMFDSYVNLYLPKFKLKFKSSLKEALKNMGMGIAFDPSLSDFRNLYDGTEKAYISDVNHSTYVDVYEEGTEAAAVTSVEIGITSIREEMVMRCDKPFVFLIRERNSNSILFIGKLFDPSDNQ